MTMKRTITAGVLVTLVVTNGLVAQQQRRQDIDLQEAIRTETVELDLNGAIAKYKVIADRYGSTDRPVATKALLQLAGLYQKLGRAADARAVYARVISEFSDQTAAVNTARERLGPGGPTPSTTRVWGDEERPPDVPVDDGGSVSRDGGVLSFTDWTTGDLAIRDLVSGTTRRLTKHPVNYAAGYAAESWISTDGRQVAYTHVGPIGDATPTLRVVDITGANGRVVHANRDIDYIKPVGWSPDGTSILAVVTTRSRSAKLSIISAAAGTETVLRTLPWGSLGSVRLSPDGRHVAYDVRVRDTGPARKVVLLAVDASREVTIVESATADSVVDWTPDGARLLFTSLRGGSAALLSVRIVDGRAEGEPTIVRPDLGRLRRPLGVTRTGALLYSVSVSTSEVYRMKWNEAEGRPVGPSATPAGRRLLGDNRNPIWSPDGKRLAYLTEASRQGTPSLTFVSADGRDEQNVPVPDLTLIGALSSWAPDGRSVLVRGLDQKKRHGAYSVDVATGAARVLVHDHSGATLFGPQWLPDGRHLVFFRRSDVPERQHEIVIHDVEAGTERPILRYEAPEFSQTHLSPDGQLLAIRTDNGVRVLPLAGGAAIELARSMAPVEYRVAGWTPDSRHVLITAARTRAPGREEYQLFRVPAGGGAHVAVPGIDPSARVIHFNPTGQEVAFQVSRGGAEIWRMDGWR
jgi:Tol biopolymer transport system component